MASTKGRKGRLTHSCAKTELQVVVSRAYLPGLWAHLVQGWGSAVLMGGNTYETGVYGVSLEGTSRPVAVQQVVKIWSFETSVTVQNRLQ